MLCCQSILINAANDAKYHYNSIVSYTSTNVIIIKMFEKFVRTPKNVSNATRIKNEQNTFLHLWQNRITSIRIVESKLYFFDSV